MLVTTLKNKISPYKFLPFKFMRYPRQKMLVVNEAGEYLFLTSNEFNEFLNFTLPLNSSTYLDLKAKHFLYDSDKYLAPTIDLLATKYRTKKAFLRNFTTLHMVVTTLRCNHRCNYCHASSQDASLQKFDMSIKTARRVTEIIFETPSPIIKIEFQGGESLLNFEVVREIVIYAEHLNKKKKKQLSFVLCTNLTLIDKEALQFLKDHCVLISTSLDGPHDLHNANRIMRDGGDSYKTFIEKLELTRDALGHEQVSALLTVTNGNRPMLHRVVDEYVRLGFDGIFLRSLNPYGYAKKESGRLLQYSVEEFVQAYKETLKYIIDLNLKGKLFSEYFANILLSRIMTPFPTGFMDLQSPAGAGILGVIYNYNGDVYPTDEARMLANTGDTHFRLGNVHHNTYDEIFNNELLKKITKNSCTETIPGCHSCAFQIYCGADPIRAYSQQNDKTYMGHIPSSEFCKKHKSIIAFLIDMIENNPDACDVFWTWITRRDLQAVRI